MDQINTVTDQERFFFSWQKGALLLIDNLFMNHGGNSFEAGREVAVTIANVWGKV